MKFHFFSIRQKLMGIVSLTVMAALSLALIGKIAGDIWVFHRSMVADTATQSELLGRMSVAALSFDDPRLATATLKLLEIRPNIHAAAIYNEQGKLFATYAAAGKLGQFPAFPGMDDVRIEGRTLILFKRIVNDGNLLGTVYMRADYDLTDIILEDIKIATAVSIFAMAIALLMMARLGKIIADPITAIAAAASEVVTQRDYSRRVKKTSNDEVGVMVESFNDMLAEIERRTMELETSNREITRESEQRELAQQEILRLNADLERRVSERTAELEKSNQELSIATAEAKKANQAKSEFLSRMSHELRTPLNVILGFGQLLASDTLPSTEPQKKDFTHQILKAGKHLLTLINEILDLAKIESGTITLSVESVALTEIMQECQAMIEPLGAKHNIQVIFPKQTGLAVLADRTRLKQVMLNLLSNAIKYNRTSGTVVIDCEVAAAERVRISVRDTGVGLSPTQVANLFQPFNRLGRESGAEEGTGIGLVVTKRLVELMEGSIGVMSTPEIGSVFWIELKAAASAQPELETKIDEAPAIAAVVPHDPLIPTLLYVEDNPANMKLVEEIIHFRSDLRLLAAPDAHLGIELARVHLPEIILMDINLPGMSGTDAMKFLRDDPETAQIPVIAITANAMPKDVAEGMRQGFFRYITKPINIDELNEAIDSALQLSTLQRSHAPVKSQATI